jgi:hypothetical protein
MAQKITSAILEAFLNCKLKASLKLSGQQGQQPAYDGMLADLREQVRLKALDKILSQQSLDRVQRGGDISHASLKLGALFILDAVLEDDNFRLHIDGLKKVKGASAFPKRLPNGCTRSLWQWPTPEKPSRSGI